VLFSEPKIPQLNFSSSSTTIRHRFSALQRAENSSIRSARSTRSIVARFSALQRAENSSIESEHAHSNPDASVSVLFSEPKIPQSHPFWRSRLMATVSVLFSEPKIPQSQFFAERLRGAESFSALQRAENSSMANDPDRPTVADGFQCSSASRKFLNPTVTSAGSLVLGFSALQRAENSSINVLSVRKSITGSVSVLFSEPKIPQLMTNRYVFLSIVRFQCSSASRKFLNRNLENWVLTNDAVSVLFSEPKIPQSFDAERLAALIRVSVLFSEPKIPQSRSSGKR